VRHNNKAAVASGEQISLGIANFGDAKTVATFFPFLPALNVNGFVDGDRFFVLDRHFCGNGLLVSESRELTHGFIEDNRDNATVSEAGAPGVMGTEGEAAARAASVEIEIEGELHASGIRCAATEAAVGGLGFEFDDVGHNYGYFDPSLWPF
jgi:hypothetical protein